MKFQILFLFAILLSACAQVTSEDEWQVYNNNSKHYSIRYPKEFSIQKEGHSSVNLLNYDMSDPAYSQGNPEGIKIQIQTAIPKISVNYSIEQAIIDSDTPVDYLDIESDNSQKVSLGNDIVLSKHYNKTPGGAFMEYMAFDTSRRVAHSILIFEPGYSKNIELVENIISTFEITK